MKLCLTIVLYFGLVGLNTALFRRCVDNWVKRGSFDNDIVRQVDYLTLYSIEINTSSTYGKVKSFFDTEANNFFQIAYNEDNSTCQNFDRRNYVVETFLDFRRECLRFEALLYTRQGNEITRFFSQDTSKYFWWFICLDGDVDSIESFDSCKEGFFDLNIPDIRPGRVGELDLSGLPWDKIAEDLEAFTGLEFEDPEIKYGWIGEECFFE